MSMPETVGVIGGGRMGAGIAHAFALTGSRVVIVERDDDAAAAALERVHASLKRSAQKGFAQKSLDKMTDAVSASTAFTALRGSALVVEAVFEDRPTKIDTLRQAEEIISTGTPLASNTSSISIDELASALENPQRFLGLHFFNPVPTSTLVEIVIGSRTASELESAARGWVAGLGKAPVVVRDSPGFASSRLGVALALEAIRMVEAGVASAEDIDTAMEQGYRHPVGPLRTTDIVGLDVRLGIAEELHRKLGERFAPPELLRKLVADGRLGRKSGQGFYEWSES
ncbi:3-hydroxyacyl-CoA dehydrogenase family protein [Microbacterium sp.]|uniref:3-hydroxyacyl-CoA dehydrogenase family protein n=1 Tax=Microbacterium sp. TaxID=51671 RepID=UPI002638025A|nr:3-hydroxyacyl-CoA dehydrogenase family protein [Microbacterium sp.]